MINEKLAWSDGPDHVIVRVGGMECGLDLSIARTLDIDLHDAIEAAKQRPFDRWFNSLQPGYYESHRRLPVAGHNLPITRDEAEKLFNDIREAQ